MLLHKHYRITSIEGDIVRASLFAISKAFDPNEARDSGGKWTSGGSSKFELSHERTQGSHQRFTISNSGKGVAELWIDTTDPEHLYVDWLGQATHPDDPEGFAGLEDPFEGVDVKDVKLGPRAVRDIARQLRTYFPEAKTISGERVSGARPKVGNWNENVSVNMDLFKALSEELAKFNPYHDNLGRFTSSSNSPATTLLRNFDSNKTLSSVIKRLPPPLRARIAEAKQIIASSPSTKEQHTSSDGTYTPEREALHKSMLERMFSADVIKNTTPQSGTNPELIMTGGRPGSGKTTALRGIDKSKYFYLSADTIRESMPGYNGTNAELYLPEARDVVAQAERIARGAGLNIIYDATMAKTQQTHERVALYKSAGYDVKGYYVHTAPDVATRRAMRRFMETGYFVPPEEPFNQRNNEATFDTLTSQFKHWVLIDNNGKRAKVVAEGGQP